jgi:hypothetical protein
MNKQTKEGGLIAGKQVGTGVQRQKREKAPGAAGAMHPADWRVFGPE